MTLRSLLFVPASRHRMLAKGSELPADAIVVDLEDGVAPADKTHARSHVRSVVEHGTLGHKPWLLRVNAPATPWHEDDMSFAASVRPAWVLVPKAENAPTIGRVGERAAGFGARLGLMLETAAGVARALELAGAHPHVELLVFGAADYRLSIGARPDPDRRSEQHALSTILLAARTHRCWAIDAVYFRFRDRVGLERHARLARDLGYDGKSCIHPGQLATVHAVFSSTPEELAWASAVLRAWDEQDGERNAVVILEGEMIEALHVTLARRIMGSGLGLTPVSGQDLTPN